jgi:ABC-type lipoprotein export system ATPase subunit
LTPAAADIGKVGAPILEGPGLEKFYMQPDGGHIEVVSPTNIQIMPGKIVALLRPSGCGKSTLLPAATPVMSVIVVTVNRVLWQRLYRLAATRYRLES